jgi:hypothetical protein
MTDHSQDPDYVEVFRFLHYDPINDGTLRPTSKRTRRDIERIGGSLIEGTGEYVRKDALDDQGRYYTSHG